MYPPVSLLRRQRHGLLPRPAQLQSAQPPTQLSDQAAEHGRSEQHALPAAHRQEDELGSILIAQARECVQAAAHGTVGLAGWFGSICGAGNGTKIYQTSPSRNKVFCFDISNAFIHVAGL